MPIYSSEKMGIRTKAGVEYEFVKKFGINAKGEFYFILPEIERFIAVCKNMQLETRFTGQNRRTRTVVFKSKDDMEDAFSNFIKELIKTDVQKELVIAYENNSSFRVYKHNITGNTRPKLDYSEDVSVYTTYDNNHSMFIGVDNKMTISISAGVFEKCTYTDDQANSAVRYVVPNYKELSDVAKEINDYNFLRHKVTNNRVLNRDVNFIPYTENAAKFFADILRKICLINMAIFDNFKLDKIEEIANSNITLIGNTKNQEANNELAEYSNRGFAQSRSIPNSFNNN